MVAGTRYVVSLLAALLSLAFGQMSLAAQDASKEDASKALSRMLLDMEVAAKTAEAEIAKLPSIVDDECARIRNSLDRWANSQLRAIVAGNHAAVGRLLDATHLPQEEGAFSVWWKQTKAGVGSDGDLDALLKTYFSILQPGISSVNEEFQKQIMDSLGQETLAGLQESMERIRKPFIGILKQRLPIYNTIPVPNTDRATATFSTSGKMGDFRQGAIPVKGLVGAALIFLGKRIVTRIMKFLAVKIAGKVLAKLLPVVGWILLAFEVYDIAGARDRFEDEMRKAFLSEYTAEINAETLWWKGEDAQTPSMRDEVSRNVCSLLKNWERICRSEAASMIQSAHILSFSEPVREYVSKELDGGAEFEPVLQKMGILWDVFGPLLAQGKIDTFESMILATPDRNDLRLLAANLGPRLLEMYRKFGRDFLQGVNRIGVRNYLSAGEWADGRIDWKLLNGRLSLLPDLGDDREASLGLLTLVQEDAPFEGIAPASLSDIAANRELFRSVWRAIRPDIRKTLLILGNKKAASTVGECLEVSPGAASAFLGSYGPEFWTAWSRDDILILLRITDFRSTTLGKPIDACLPAAEDRAAMIAVWRRTGKQGIALWDAYATEGAGALGRKLANDAVESLSDGYPFGDLRDRAHLEFAVACRKIPFAGRLVYDTFRNLGAIPRILVVAAGAAAVLGMILAIFGRRRR